MRSWSPHRLVVLGLLAVIVASVAAWWATRETLPDRLVVATAHETGSYHKLAGALEERYEARTGRALELRTTRGSWENLELLESGAVDLAILQGSALEESGLADLAVLAALHPEVLHVVVRAESTIQKVLDLPGHAVSIGEPGSGMRESAAVLLRHYRIDAGELAASEAYFEDLATNPVLEAAIVTTGLDNPGLCTLLDSGAYRLLPVDGAAAIALARPTFDVFEIPRGFYDERPALPPTPTTTVATTAVLVSRVDCSARVVAEVLGALYERDLRASFPHLIPKDEVLASSPVPIHPKAREVLDPYADLDRMAAAIESLNGIKELFVGFFALCYLVWGQVRRSRERQREAEVARLKDHLDEYLSQTIRIERAQLETHDPAELRAHLRELTRVKLEALDELTGEELRADQSFQIFLMQCANLSRKIQGRLSFLQAERLARP